MSDTRNLVTAITDALDNRPEAWEFNEFLAKRTDGLEIWIANGRDCTYIYSPAKLSLGFFDKRRLWAAIRRCKINKLVMLNHEFNVKRTAKITTEIE